jgi:hypothetical protein
MIDVKSLNPLEKKVNRELLKYAVQRQIFCEFSGNVLDVRRAVLVETPGRAYVVNTERWDEVKDDILGHPALAGKVTVYDGRDYYTPSGRAR